MHSRASSTDSKESDSSDSDVHAKFVAIRDRVSQKQELQLTMESVSDVTGPQENPKHLDGVPEMSQLIYLHTDAVVHNLDVRYGKDQIYTSMQSVLLAVNPYRKLPLYSSDIMDQYRLSHRNSLSKLPPHCFRMAELAYQGLARYHKNQSLIICGESGSGKTESAKVFMRYLAHVTGAKTAESKDSIENRFLQVNPVLEALGNAQTNMNNNSSRYAKFTQVVFEKKGEPPASMPPHQRPKKLFRPPIIGSFVETYLLEKSRVVHQDRGERNYHVFYQVLAGLSDELKQEFGVPDVKKIDKIDEDDDDTYPGVLRMKTFKYMNQSGCFVQGDNNRDDHNFKQVEQALSDLNFSSDEQKGLWGLICGILHLGNIAFSPVSEDECAIDQKEDVDAVTSAARCFAVPVDQLITRLTTRNITVGGNTISKPLKQEDAIANRDTMAKTLYHESFQLVVKRINELLTAGDRSLWIGILDVFGFECSDWNNSFEQLCINFANERLQSHFNENVVMSEQEEYMKEALPWTPVQIKDNSDIVNLISQKPKGLFALLDSACIVPGGNDGVFLQNVMDAHKRNKRLKLAKSRRSAAKDKPSAGTKGSLKGKEDDGRFSGFILEHYAGKVVYNVRGFLSKNNDTVNTDTALLFSASGSPFTASVLPKPEPAGASRNRRRGSTTAFRSVGTHFQTQLAELMSLLESTTPHFVRCINPNQFKLKNSFDSDYVRPQLEYGGLVEALAILKLGYPSRISYENIYDRYGKSVPFLNKGGTASIVQQKEFAEAVFLAFGLELDAYKLGLTKVFFRPGKQEWLEDVLGANAELSPEMLARVRKLIFQKRFTRLRGALMLMTKMKLWINKRKAFHNFTKTVGKAVVIMNAMRGPLRLMHQRRGAVVLQASLRTAIAVRKAKKQTESVSVVSAFLRGHNRRLILSAELEKRVAATQAKKAAALKEEAARKKREEEIKAKQEAEAKKKAEEAAARQAMYEAAEKKRLEEEAEAARKKEEEAKRVEEEYEQREQERIKAEEERRKRAALARHQEERKRMKEKAARERAKRQEKEQELKRLQEEAEREAAEVARLQDRADEEEAEEELEERRQLRAMQKEQLAREEAERAQTGQEEEEEEDPGAPPAPPEDSEDPKEPPEVPPLPATTGTPLEKKDNKDTKDSKKRYSIPSHVLAAHMQEKALQAELRKEETAKRMRHVLLTGGKFVKYGRQGAPHIRQVMMNVLGNIHWSSKPMDCKDTSPSDTFIPLRSVVHVAPGKETAVFKQKHAKNIPEFLCFSIIGTERTLDLQATNVKERNLWVKAIESAMVDIRQGMTDMISGVKPDDGKKGDAAAKKKVIRRHTLQPRQLAQVQAAAKEFDAERSGLGAGASTAYQSAFGSEEEMMGFVLKGGEFLKFEAKGKPQIVYIDSNDKKLFIGEAPNPSTLSNSKSVALYTVDAVKAGKVTDTFLYRSTDALSPPENCFSLILKGRTIDLQVETLEMRDKWVAAMTTLVDRARRRYELRTQQAGPGGKKGIVRSQSMRVVARSERNQPVRKAPLPSAWLGDSIKEEDA